MITLYHGDCLIEMSKIADGSVDTILCDLPYGTTACKWDNIIPFRPLWEHYWRVLKPNGAVLLFASQPFTTNLIYSQLDSFRYSYIWLKNRQTGIALAGKQPMRQFEDIAVFYRKKSTYNPIMRESESKIMKSHAAKGYTRGLNATSSEHLPNMGCRREAFKTVIYPSNVLKFDVVNNRCKDRFHPTQKPTPLLEFLINTHTNKGETVLDNTMGCGSTGVACVNTSRKFIGIEMDDKYFSIAKERIEKAKLRAYGYDSFNLKG